MATDEFCQTTGLHCRRGCGACCQTPDISTTPLELLPLAQSLLAQGKDQEILKAIESHAHAGHCIMHEVKDLSQSKGRCTAYEYRPGICRLFGFAAQKNKYDQVKLLTCKTIKSDLPQAVDKAQAHLDQGLPAPAFYEYQARVNAIDPFLGATPMPFNQALQKAIQYLGLKQDLSKNHE